MGVAEWSAEAEGSPEKAAAIILSPDGLKQWFQGVNRAEAEAGWPAKGTRMRWWVGGGDRWTFTALVTEDARPLYVVTEVQTPSANSLITHRFDPLPGGRTMYTKRVQPRYNAALLRLFGPPLEFFLRRWVRAEVRRAAALVRR